MRLSLKVQGQRRGCRGGGRTSRPASAAAGVRPCRSTRSRPRACGARLHRRGAGPGARARQGGALRGERARGARLGQQRVQLGPPGQLGQQARGGRARHRALLLALAPAPARLPKARSVGRPA